MSDKILLPEVMVFAGPNGSGKTTITSMAKIVGTYINADDIKQANHCSDLEAAQKAEALREQAIKDKQDFTFETVLSTDRNIKLLRKAKEEGYFTRCIYVLTANPDINVACVANRKAMGGHDVPEIKIRSRYQRAIKLIPELIALCDIVHIYDNTQEPFRIFKKTEKPVLCLGESILEERNNCKNDRYNKRIRIMDVRYYVNYTAKNHLKMPLIEMESSIGSNIRVDVYGTSCIVNPHFGAI